MKFLYRRPTLLTKAYRWLALTSLSAILVPSVFAQIEEIVVTATKRQATLQEIPIAVSVVGQETIQQARILDLLDIQSVVPSLRVNQLQSSQNTNFTIRGFGNGANNAGIEPSVAVLIDGVIRSRSSGRIGDLPNLERIEVISGPQSTLFGKNASVGVISIVTSKPQQETQGNIQVGFGNFNEATARGYVTGGITDNLALSLGGSITLRDGYFDSIDPNLDNVNDRNRWSLRGQALYTTDSFEARFIADYSTLEEQCCGVTNVVESETSAIIDNLNATLNNEIPGQGLASVNDPFSFIAFQNTDSINELDDYGFSLHLEKIFSSFDISSITAYRFNDSFFDTDADYNRLNILDSVRSDQEISTFTQEVRITSNTEGRVDWMVGGYLFLEDVNLNAGLEYGEDIREYVDVLAGGAATLGFIESSLGLEAGTFFAGDTLTDEFFTQDDTTYSIFSTVDFHITDRLTLTGGINYTQSKKDFSGRTVNSDVFSAVDFTGPQGAAVIQATPGAVPSVIFAEGLGEFESFEDTFGLAPTEANRDAVAANPDTAAAFVIFNATVDALAANPTVAAAVAAAVAASPNSPLSDLQGLQFQPPFLAFPNAVENSSTDDDDVSWTARLAYDYSDQLNFYFNVATGFKASSINLSRDSRPLASDIPALEQAGLTQPNQASGTRFALPEETLVYEIGAKGNYDNFSFNIALFDQTVKNFQSNAFIGSSFVLTNAGEQSVQGAEIELTYLPIENLELKFSGTFLDPVFDSFPNAPGPIPGVPIDRTGDDPDNVNTTSLSFIVNYSHDFGNGISGYLRADYQYENATQHSVNLTLASLAQSALAPAASPGTDLTTTPPTPGIAQTVDFVPGFESREQSLVNASAGLRFEEQEIELQVWGRNIFNDEFVTTLFPGVAQFGIVNAYPNQPATYGVSVRKSF